MKTTDWFPPHINPVHVGWYKRRFISCDPKTYFNYWDGQYWYYSLHLDPDDRVTKNHGRRADNFVMEWCGLAEKPK